MTKRKPSYDPRCRDLAELFLDAEPERSGIERSKEVDDLAQHIQDAIENWFAGSYPSIFSIRRN